MMSFSKWLNKQTVVLSDSRILFRAKKKWPVQPWKEMVKSYWKCILLSERSQFEKTLYALKSNLLKIFSIIFDSYFNWLFRLLTINKRYSIFALKKTENKYRCPLNNMGISGTDPPRSWNFAFNCIVHPPYLYVHICRFNQLWIICSIHICWKKNPHISYPCSSIHFQGFNCMSIF